MNLTSAFSAVTEYFSPRIIAEVNNEYVKVARIKGQEVPWHNHADEDEMFYIVDGELLMEIEHEEPFIMRTGDLYVVRKGINHRVSSVEECKIMLVESKTTAHTGTVASKITKTLDQQSY